MMLTDNIISLRAPEPADIESMYLWENDATIWSDGAVRAPMSKKLLQDYVNCYNPDPNVTGQLRMIITLNTTGEALGCIDLYDYDALNRKSGVGIVIDGSFRRRGYGKNALLLLAEYCREELGLHQLWAIISRTNVASLSLFESAGFNTAGCLRSWIRRGESYSDALFFQKLLVRS